MGLSRYLALGTVAPNMTGVHLSIMTVSMRVMSAGDGYKYLLRSVAAADGDRSLSTPLTRYYAEEGTRWGRRSSPLLIGLFVRF